jgi:hypothetical protein
MKNAMIAAIVAAVVASGSAVAATKLIDGHTIKNHTIPSTKLTEAAVASLHGAGGDRIRLVEGDAFTVPIHSAGEAIAVCPSGWRAVAGGWEFITGSGFGVNSSPGPDHPGIWRVTVLNENSGPSSLRAWAACAS